MQTNNPKPELEKEDPCLGGEMKQEHPCSGETKQEHPCSEETKGYYCVLLANYLVQNPSK
jgi:hypothetical protein